MIDRPPGRPDGANQLLEAAVDPLADVVGPLLAVLVGAVASYIAVARSESRRWRRESRTRWDQRRLDAYAEYADAVKDCVQVSLNLCAARGITNGLGAPLDPAEGAAVLAGAEADRAALFEKVLLLGEPSTVAAARAWHAAVWRMQRLAHGLDTADAAAFGACFRDVAASRQDFYAAARRDLGIPGVPPEPELPDSIGGST